MQSLEKLEKKYEELGKEIERLKNKKDNKRWRAEKENYYWYITNIGKKNCCADVNDNYDNCRYAIGNYFKTEEEAEKQLKKLKIYIQLKDLADRLNGDEEIDWNDKYQYKHHIGYNNLEDEFECKYINWGPDLGQIYCLNRNFKNIALEEIGEENLKLLFDVESEEN